MRSSNTKYPFDGRKERMVDDGKHIILVFIVFGLFIFNDFDVSRFSIHRFWLYTVFDIRKYWYPLYLALHLLLYIGSGYTPFLASFFYWQSLGFGNPSVLAIHCFWQFIVFGNTLYLAIVFLYTGFGNVSYLAIHCFWLFIINSPLFLEIPHHHQ